MSQSKRSLERVQRLFTSWRRHRIKGRDRIPERLWDAAVGASVSHGAGAVSQKVGLDYYELRRRFKRVQKGPQVSAKDFVEVPILPAAASSVDHGSVVEITDPRGYRMRLCAVDVDRVVGHFMGVRQ